MATILKKLPDVIGFYMPGDRRDDWSGEITDPKTGELVKEPSMTKQSFVAECDINNIIKEFTPQGLAALSLATMTGPGFEELPDAIDYQAALEIARSAEGVFAQLPAQVRKRFDNDPQAFLAFMGDPGNQDEMISLGLARDTRPPKVLETPPAPPKGEEPPKA